MSFGAVITYGDNNQPIPDELSQWLVEVRIEQELNKPARFAIRFEDDICGDSFEVQNNMVLQPDSLIGIFVPVNNQESLQTSEMECLIIGRVTKIKSSLQLGGPGTWIEFHGEDRRIEMDRLAVTANWQGNGADIISSILSSYDFNPDVSDIDSEYTETEQLNQSGTDLSFLNKIINEHGLNFWIEYEVDSVNQANGQYSVNQTAIVKISPPDEGATDLTLLPIDNQEASFRVNVIQSQCPNVNVFSAEVDTEVPNARLGQNNETESHESEQRTEAIGEGQTITEVGGAVRTIPRNSPGTEEDRQLRERSTLREASWFVEASVSTSVHMYGKTIHPHSIILVEGAGNTLSVPYQVKSVTHVVNASDHMMDIKLRSNTLGSRGA